MSEITLQRLFSARHAFDHPVTVWLVAFVGALLLACPLVIRLLDQRGRLTPAHRSELWQRYLTWLVLAPAMIGPVLLGAFWTILAVAILSLACYREYARATGLFRERLISSLVVVAILFTFFAALDHWYGFFMALGPLGVATIVALPIFQDRPHGYIQRTALGVLAFMVFGVGMGHLAYLANDANYRPVLLLLVLSVELNDVFAYISGKLLGRRKLAPATSPNKTVEGSLGALVLTTLLVAIVGRFIFRDTLLEAWPRLMLLGILVSVLGQLGDLLLSSIKRDLGVKDMGQLLPGHGGLLDRFDSLLLVAPAWFHFIGYFVGIGLHQPMRIITG